MKSTAQLLGDYSDALRKWKKMKEVREESDNAARLKPLPPEPDPAMFSLKPDDLWTIKTRDLIMSKRILPIKTITIPARRTK